MNFTANPLTPILSALEAQNHVLGKVRNDYLSKEAERRNYEARLVKEAMGKSHAEKVMNAQSMDEWLGFHKSLARLEAIYEFQKLKFTVLEKEWQSQYLCLKLDAGLIRKQE